MFFFCKQKTAYEMRISDWSSDVCSSDLPGVTAAATAQPARYARKATNNGLHGNTPDTSVLSHIGLNSLQVFKQKLLLLWLKAFEYPFLAFKGVLDEDLGGMEIGRASCRERVVQYG